MKKTGTKKFCITLAAIFAVIAAIYALSWISTPFSDFYVRHIYPIYSAVPVFLSGLLPFSLGEIMIILLVVSALLGIPAIITFAIIKRNDSALTKKVFKAVVGLCCVILVYVFATETLGCFVMYHCTEFSAILSPSSTTRSSSSARSLR